RMPEIAAGSGKIATASVTASRYQVEDAGPRASRGDARLVKARKKSTLSAGIRSRATSRSAARTVADERSASARDRGGAHTTSSVASVTPVSAWKTRRQG